MARLTSARESDAQRGLVAQFSKAAGLASLHLLTTGLTLLFGVVCARALGAEDFGTYVVWMAMAGLLATLSCLGLPQLLGRELASARGNGEGEVLPPLVQLLFLIAALLAAATLISFFLGSQQIGFAFLFALLSHLLLAMNSIFIAEERILSSRAFGVALRPAVALAVLLALFFVAGATLLHTLLAQCLGTAISALTLVLLWRSCIPQATFASVTRLANLATYGSLLRLGFNFAVTQFAINLMTQVDVLILSRLTEPEVTGYYYASARAGLVVGFFYSSALAAAEPTLVRLMASNDRDGAVSVIRNTTWGGFLATVAAALFAVLLGPWYLRLYGPGFEAAYPALIIVILGLMAQSLFGPAQPLLRAARADRSFLRLTVLSLLVGALLTTLAVPVFGLTGAAIGTAMQFALFGYLSERHVTKATGLKTAIWHHPFPTR